MDPETFSALLKAGPWGGVILVTWVLMQREKRRRKVVSESPKCLVDASEFAVMAERVAELKSDLKEYHREVRLYYQATERSLEKRHTELTTLLTRKTA